jgi:hypothetical protein
MMNTSARRGGFEDFAKERTEVAFKEFGGRPLDKSKESNQLVYFRFPWKVSECGDLSPTVPAALINFPRSPGARRGALEW